jgi:hypothetical protein
MKKKDKIKWDEFSNSEIKIKQLELKNEFEAKKNQINHLCDDLDAMEILYNESIEILNKRLKNG